MNAVIKYEEVSYDDSNWQRAGFVGVWFPSDPRQMPWSRFLDEVAEAGYEWIELGPYGYLPTDLKVLQGELSRRNLKACAGFVMRPLEDPGIWPEIEKEILGLGRVLAGLGAAYLVLIDDTYTNVFTGEVTGSPELDPAAWQALIAATQKAVGLRNASSGSGSLSTRAPTHTWNTSIRSSACWRTPTPIWYRSAWIPATMPTGGRIRWLSCAATIGAFSICT